MLIEVITTEDCYVCPECSAIVYPDSEGKADCIECHGIGIHPVIPVEEGMYQLRKRFEDE